MMQLFIFSNKNIKKPVWDHFLLNNFEVKCSVTDSDNNTNESKGILEADKFTVNLSDKAKKIELTIASSFAHAGKSFTLLHIVQVFEIKKEADGTVKIIPVRWVKSSGNQYRLNKAIPAVHPLLKIDNNTIYLNVFFADITALFGAIHFNTPWFQALDLLKGTNRTILVLASIMGQPLIWYVVIPGTAYSERIVQPNVLFYPADYGGIYYDQTSFAGITSQNHHLSVGNIQSGGETLFSFLTNPVTDEDYFNKLDNYLNLSRGFNPLKGRNPPPFHHFRKTLNYNIENRRLIPRYWDIPFGFEEAIANKKNILIIPQLNGGSGDMAISAFLKDMVDNIIMTVYAGKTTLNYDTISINNLIITAYSESGGNVFTAAYKNIKDIKALILFEPQYMNAHLKTENRNLILGKQVIPLLLKAGAKVAIIGRHKSGWEYKYLPDSVNASQLIILPSDAEYFLLDYPLSNIPYNPNRSPILQKRYSRLLKSKADPVIKSLLSDIAGDKDVDSAQKEESIERIIEDYKAKGLSDEQIVKIVFTPDFNADKAGGFYTHNFIISSGHLDKSFFHEALEKIG